jgi:hypothetical protein
MRVFRGARRMLPAIKLDDQMGIGTTEIHDVAINCDLSLEFQAS